MGRARRGGQDRDPGPPGRDSPDEGCYHGITGLQVKRTVAKLKGNAGRIPVAVYLERSILYRPATGRPTPLQDQRDGPPCPNPDCPYAYVVAVPHRTLAGAMHAGAAHAQPSGSVARHFVGLSLLEAVTVDASGLPELAEARLRSNDPIAHEHVRAMRDAGIEAAWIPSTMGGPLMLLFTESVGNGTQVDFERSQLFDGLRWHGDGFFPGGFEGRRMIVETPDRERGRGVDDQAPPGLSPRRATVLAGGRRVVDALGRRGGLAVERCEALAAFDLALVLGDQ